MMKGILIIGIMLLGGIFPSKASAYPEADSTTVYIFLSDECIISQNYTLVLNQLHEAYDSEQLNFVGIFPNFASKPDKIQAFKEKYNIQFPLKTDYFKTLTQKLDAKVTPEVVVFNHKTNTTVYKGRIDNMYARVGQKRRVTTTSELKDVLDALQKGLPAPIRETEAVGCFINFQDGL